jgi:hypothetical protein
LGSKKKILACQGNIVVRGAIDWKRWDITDCPDPPAVALAHIFYALALERAIEWAGQVLTLDVKPLKMQFQLAQWLIIE